MTLSEIINHLEHFEISTDNREETEQENCDQSETISVNRLDIDEQAAEVVRIIDQNKQNNIGPDGNLHTFLISSTEMRKTCRK